MAGPHYSQAGGGSSIPARALEIRTRHADGFAGTIDRQQQNPRVADSWTSRQQYPVRHSRRIHTQDPHAVLWEVPNADHCRAVSVAPKEFEERILDWFSLKPQNVARQRNSP